MSHDPQLDSRPDPDQLLARIKKEEVAARRGKLRIYFGASAGVGKTFSMLSAAQKARAEGVDVVIGLVETHGRAETIERIGILETLPRKSLIYRDNTVQEFDLDAALARAPALLLVDELAHSNIDGNTADGEYKMRHPKRWQDVEELLNAGIDVWTTLNVQHLESLNDVVSGITGIRVAETLPDHVFDDADELVMVDIPADELLARLKAGKVYSPQQAERAAKNFFRKGNIIALREIALRRTADRVEDDVKTYRVEKSIAGVWKTDASLLALIGPSSGAEHVVRSAARLASQLNATWHALYVETPRLQRLPAEARERILNVMKLAETLGATTSVASGDDIARSATEYARANNLGKIIVGRRERASLWPMFGKLSPSEQLASLAPDADVIVVGRPLASGGPGTSSAHDKVLPIKQDERRRTKQMRYAWTVLTSAVTTLIATPLLPYFDLANIVMLFLLNVVLTAVKFGRGPAMLAAFLSVASFDFFFVPPRFSFAVSDVQYLLTFAVMLVVALIIGQMTAGLRFQARIATHREERARSLFAFAKTLSGVLQSADVTEKSVEVMERTFRSTVHLILPDKDERLIKDPTHKAPNDAADIDMAIAQWAFDKGLQAGLATDTLPTHPYRYIPLKAPMRTRGILAIKPSSPRWLLIPEQQRQIETFANLIAIALERVHYVEVAQETIVKMESERLRGSLLAALSHDLRTPLTALLGLAESLSMTPLSNAQKETSLAIRDESLRMNTLVNNLLDMARIQSGEIKLRREWQPIEEVIGTAIRSISGSNQLWGARKINVQIAPDAPLLEFDSVLIERVLANLLENAAKYTPRESSISISVSKGDTECFISISDNGPGIVSGQERTIFEKFSRGVQESAMPGVGLGLAICRAIVEAHHGKIWAQNKLTADAAGNDTHGAEFIFTLPIGTPPMVSTIE
jgi:two-component system, OmpR family, sensor histidine kinase KdpD